MRPGICKFIYQAAKNLLVIGLVNLHCLVWFPFLCASTRAFFLLKLIDLFFDLKDLIHQQFHGYRIAVILPKKIPHEFGLLWFG